MDQKRVAEIARVHANKLLSDTDMQLDVMQEACIQAEMELAILEALLEAMGPANEAMAKEGADFLPITPGGATNACADNVWTAMAAVRLRDVLSGAKE